MKVENEIKLILILILFTTVASVQDNLLFNKFHILQISSQDGKQIKKNLWSLVSEAKRAIDWLINSTHIKHRVMWVIDGKIVFSVTVKIGWLRNIAGAFKLHACETLKCSFAGNKPRHAI